mmetsp:Transcript_39225/g.77171  ORF Transcript_39225/g.77171 Transcript_39225/m.77171 type:complete len:110 (+) Transcript_39225:3509-3838(+)
MRSESRTRRGREQSRQSQEDKKDNVDRERRTDTSGYFLALFLSDKTERRNCLLSSTYMPTGKQGRVKAEAKRKTIILKEIKRNIGGNEDSLSLQRSPTKYARKQDRGRD